MLPNGTWARFVLCLFFMIAVKGEGQGVGCIKTIIFHDSQTSSSVSAMELIRKDGVSIMKVHVHLSAKEIQRAKRRRLAFNLSLPCREADRNDLQIASSAKRRGKTHIDTHTHAHTQRTHN